MKNNFLKKTAAGLLALLIVAGATPPAPFSKTFDRTAITANAAEVVSGNCGKSTNEGGEESVKWSLDDEGTLTISGTGDMEDYTGVKPWVDYSAQIKTVVIEDGVTSIGNKSFYYYQDALTSVTIPASVTSIGESAFDGCTELKSISLKRATPPTLGEYAFYYSKEPDINTDLKIYVPVSSVDAYKEADNWSNYADTFTGQFYEVKLPDITGGTITADDCFIDKAAENKTVTLTVTPDTGYSVKTVKYNDGTDYIIEPVNGVYSFTMPETDVTVSADIEHTLYSINVDESISHGSVSAAVGEIQNAETAYYGDDVTLTVEPAVGYHLAENSPEVETFNTTPVTVTPHENTTTNTVYTFSMPDDSVNVTASFAPNTYTIVFDKNSEDARYTMDNQILDYDDTGNLLPNQYRRTGYKFAGWATSADGEVKYTPGEAVSNLTSVDGGTVTLYAKWTQESYGIYIPTNLEHGSVSADKTTAHYGDDVTLTVTPDEGYQLKGNTLKISANSTAVNVIPHKSTCTIAMPAGYTSVYGEFEKAPISVTYLDENGKPKTVNAIPLDGTETELDAGWYVVKNDITYEPKNASFELSGDVKIIIEDGKNLSFGKKTAPKYGISGGTLSVYGQTNGNGTMNVYADENTPVSLIGLNIYGGTLNVVTASSGHADYAIEANNIVFKNCTVNAEHEGHYAINIATDGKLTIDNADVTSKGCIYSANDGTAELIVSNSTVNVSLANTAISFYAINLINSKVETSAQSFDIQAYVVNIDGGEFTGESARGISAPQVNIGMKTADDFVKANTYFGRIVIAENQILTDGTNDYDGELTAFEQTAIAGKKLTPKTCTVTWKNEDDTILETDENVVIGTEPHYDGATPAKAGDAQYSYSFKGWYKQISETTGDVTYIAQFDREVNKYTVTWKNADGTILEIDKYVEYGTEPHYDGATPTKPDNTDYYYTFEGWSPRISAVTGNVSYTAQFNSHVKTYTITYKVDGEVYDTKSVSYGNSITLPDAPTKEGYTFSGWQTDYTTMPASNIEITGTFKADIAYSNVYFNLTHNTYSGSEISPVFTVSYGDTVLTENTDFVVESGNAGTAAGTYTLTLTGTGAYAGTLTAEWYIDPVKTYHVTVTNGTIMGDSDYEEQAVVTVVGNTEVGGWYNGETLVSAEQTYSFYAVSDVDLEWRADDAYAAEKAEEGIANITISPRIINSNGKTTVTVTSTWTLPEGAEIVQAGTYRCYVDKGTETPNSEYMIANGTFYASTLTECKGTFYFNINMGVVSAARKLCAMTYVQYTLNGETYTITSDVAFSEAD